MHPLGLLISERMEKQHLSYDDVAERGGIPKGTVWAIVKRDIKHPPRIRTLEGLAKGLDLPLDVVRDAADRTTGYRKEQVVSSDPHVSIIAAVAEQLGDGDRAALAAMAEAFLASARERDAR